MTSYVYDPETGEVVERTAPAPNRCDRTADMGATVAVKSDIHFTSRSRPRWWPYAKHHNAAGQPQFESRKEAVEAATRATGEGDDCVYGEL